MHRHLMMPDSHSPIVWSVTWIKEKFQTYIMVLSYLYNPNSMNQVGELRMQEGGGKGEEMSRPLRMKRKDREGEDVHDLQRKGKGNWVEVSSTHPLSALPPNLKRYFPSLEWRFAPTSPYSYCLSRRLQIPHFHICFPIKERKKKKTHHTWWTGSIHHQLRITSLAFLNIYLWIYMKIYI